MKMCLNSQKSRRQFTITRKYTRAHTANMIYHIKQTRFFSTREKQVGIFAVASVETVDEHTVTNKQPNVPIHSFISRAVSFETNVDSRLMRLKMTEGKAYCELRQRPVLSEPRGCLHWASRSDSTSYAMCPT